MTRALVIVGLLTLSVSDARAATAAELFDKLAKADSGPSRRAAADAILALDPMPTDEVIAILGRERASTDNDRRTILRNFDLDVPDEKGRFRAPGRQTKRTEKENDELDWFSAVADSAPSASLSDVLVDIVAIRALAASNETKGASAILDFAFSENGTAYRDECGRYLRRMAPWSLAGLILGAYTRKNSLDMRRYAKYQLERLDREAPRKALNDAPTDEFKAEILRAFAQSQYREAVFVVLDTVDHASPEVRAAARDAWMEYATGRKPPRAPKKKLLLPGGKESDKEQPMWLNHRELADIHIRERLEQITGTKPDKAATLAEMSQKLFDHYDKERAGRLDQQLEQGLDLARQGKTAEAASVFDGILVQSPSYAHQNRMADVYMALGEILYDKGEHREAAAAFGKAHAVAPGSATAETALSRHHKARAQALEAEGKDSSSALARASEIDAQVGKGGGSSDHSWLLYAGVGGAVGGLLMLIWGLVARRRARYGP